MSGVERAAALLAEKSRAQAIYYAAAPTHGPFESRQFRRWAERRTAFRTSRPDATNRGHVSRNIIAARSGPKVAKTPKPARYPAGMKHAWQRKAALAKAMAK